MPDWAKWAKKTVEFSRNIAGSIIGDQVSSYLKDLVNIHSEEVELLHSLAQTDREGYYKSALGQLTEAQKSYVDGPKRQMFLDQAQLRLFDCIARSESDAFLMAMASARIGDTYLIERNLHGAIEWYGKAKTLAKKSLGEITAAQSLRDERESNGMVGGLAVGMGLSVAACFLFPPLGMASLGVQLLGGTAASVGGLALSVGTSAAGSYLVGNTVVVAYPVETVEAFNKAIETVNLR